MRLLLFFLLLVSSSSVITPPPVQLLLLRPTNPHVIASYSIQVDILLNLTNDDLFDEITSKFQLCLIFSDFRDYCHQINQVSYSYHINFEHQMNESRIEIHFCEIGINFEFCQLTSMTSIKLQFQAPNMIIAKELWPLFLPSQEFYQNKIALLYGSIDSFSLQHFLGLSNHLYIFTNSLSLNICQNNYTAYILQCCMIIKSYHQCLPPVADLGLILLTREMISSISSSSPASSSLLLNSLLSVLSLINGRVLFLSNDLTFFEILDFLPEIVTKSITFQNIFTKTFSLQKYYQTILLADFTSFWIERKGKSSTYTPSSPHTSSSSSSPLLIPFHSINSTQMKLSLLYGFDTILLKNVCLVNQTTVLIISPSPSSPSDSKNYHEKIVFLEKRFPQWDFLLSDDLNLNHHHHHQQQQQQQRMVTWISGSSLVAIPPWTYSIIHLVQTLLQLFHHLHPRPPPSSSSSSSSPHPSPHWIHHLFQTFKSFYFFFPTLQRDELQWSLEFISLLRSFIKHHIPFLQRGTRGLLQETEEGRGKEKDGEREEEELEEEECHLFDELYGPIILFAEDMKAMIEQSSQSQKSYRYNIHQEQRKRERGRGKKMTMTMTMMMMEEEEEKREQEKIDNTLICFEELIILSPTDLSVPYFNHPHEVNAFRRYAYDWSDGTLLTDHHHHRHHHHLSYYDPLVYNRPSTSHTDSNDESDGDHHHQDHHHHHVKSPSLTPNHPLKVTLISRSHNRRIRNLDEILSYFSSSSLIDQHFFHTYGGLLTRGVYLEILSFQQQIQLMKSTDLLIFTHGAAMTNILFLQEYSGIIEIMTFPWYQIMIEGNIGLMNLYHYNLITTNRQLIRNCPLQEYEHLYEKISILKRGQFYILRQCDILVEMEMFEMLFHKATHQIRLRKRNIFQWRLNEEEDMERNMISFDETRESIEMKNKEKTYQSGIRIPPPPPSPPPMIGRDEEIE
jgi:hypothetical protein